jgi:nicotinamide-nucleotide amidase
MTAAALLDACRARGLMLAAAESCTGGMVCAALTDIAGSSLVVERGLVTYSNRAKTDLLDVRPETLAAHGAVSAEVAREMAIGLLARAPVGLALAVTGVAGPGASEAKPEGLVFFAVALRDGPLRVERRDFGALGRAEVRARSVDTVLALALALVQGGPGRP